MATLRDHKHRTDTRGTVENLQSLMVTAQVIAYPLRLKGAGRIRACEALVRGAIRRGGMTDARQELLMSDDERSAWDAANPIAE